MPVSPTPKDPKEEGRETGGREREWEREESIWPLYDGTSLRKFGGKGFST